MAKVLIITADAWLEAATRIECVAEELECHANCPGKDVDAVIVDLDGISSEHLSMVQNYARDGIPMVCITHDPSTAVAVEIPANTCIKKPVEVGHLIHVLRTGMPQRRDQSRPEGHGASATH